MFAKPVWKWINLSAFLCMVLVNVLAETIPIGGNTTGEISAMYPSPLTPAPISFAIWGLIYLYLAVFLVMQLISKSNAAATVNLGPWFLISCLANIAWIFTWHYRAMSLAMPFMVILLLSLIIMQGTLRGMQTTASQRWLIRAPFGIYYGWITVATIANMSVWLSSIGFNGWGLPSQLWQTIVLLLGSVILCAGVLVNRDILYGITGLWAYAGIMMRQLSLDNTGSSYFWSLTAIFISSVVVIFAIIFVAFACPASKIPIFSRFNRVTLSPDNKDWRKSL